VRHGGLLGGGRSGGVARGGHIYMKRKRRRTFKYKKSEAASSLEGLETRRLVCCHCLRFTTTCGPQAGMLTPASKTWHNLRLRSKKRGYLPQVEASRVVRGVDDGPKTDRFYCQVLVLLGFPKKLVQVGNTRNDPN
jgi:hypothetical protein